MPDLTAEHVHLVIPAYREARRLPAFLYDLITVSDQLAPISILIVEDSGAGPDQNACLTAIEPAITAFNGTLSVLTYPKNLGKGGAIKAGWDRAPENCRWLAFIDADGSVPAAELVRLVSTIRSRQDDNTAFFASRILMLGREVSRHLWRHLIGRAFATLSSIILQIRCYDSQCGLKCIPAQAYTKILPQLETNGFAFDIELLTFLTDTDVSIEEFPIDWHDAGGSSIRFIKDPILMFLALLNVKKRRQATTC